MSDPTGGPRFRVLFVCTANVCRSPMAERLARLMLGAGSPVVTRSAGVSALPGSPMTPDAARALARVGADPVGFCSRQLTATLVREADLVLTATRAHRAYAVGLHPPAAAATFTIAEFGALAAAVSGVWVALHRTPVARARVLTDGVRALRGLIPVDQPDLSDPYGGSSRLYRATLRRIDAAIAAPMRLVAGPAQTPTRGGRSFVSSGL
ncbi:hypothetical protein [Sphaerisporangium sp. TRM90804]|uniref:arsenate reductase/protein-tyrosine-phosphatase family protein n=1 Tax=Sphaerisporangium sp. TRM90804 TaxID=3031113 RepID=UPI00244B0EDA|nr:hypothetical protein [Sphaerisporangium sp. TRM90804]MDH2424142.1 hypothetical protein [Sphaerisporangium sp. TRM90804]